MNIFLCFSEITLFTRVSTALARGLIAPWLPPSVLSETVTPTPVAGIGDRVSSDKKKIGGGGVPNASKSKITVTFSVNPDSVPDCKRAVEVNFLQIRFSKLRTHNMRI